MTTLKLDLKILDKLIILSLIVFSSCTTVSIDEISSPVLEPITEKNIEHDLPQESGLEFITISTSLLYSHPLLYNVTELKKLPLLPILAGLGNLSSLIAIMAFEISLIVGFLMSFNKVLIAP